jgi:hypothetical protein
VLGPPEKYQTMLYAMNEPYIPEDFDHLTGETDASFALRSVHCGRCSRHSVLIRLRYARDSRCKALEGHTYAAAKLLVT